MARWWSRPMTRARRTAAFLRRCRASSPCPTPPWQALGAPFTLRPGVTCRPPCPEDDGIWSMAAHIQQHMSAASSPCSGSVGRRQHRCSSPIEPEAARSTLARRSNAFSIAIARAKHHERRARACGHSLAVLFLLTLAAPAWGQVGATVSLLSDARLRGYSLSAGRPVGQLDLSYDDPGGFYAGLSASLVAYHGVKPLGLQENIGFAKPLAGGPTIDVGIVNSNYSRHSGHDRPLSSTS